MVVEGQWLSFFVGGIPVFIPRKFVGWAERETKQKNNNEYTRRQPTGMDSPFFSDDDADFEILSGLTYFEADEETGEKPNYEEVATRGIRAEESSVEERIFVAYREEDGAVPSSPCCRYENMGFAEALIGSQQQSVFKQHVDREPPQYQASSSQPALPPALPGCYHDPTTLLARVITDHAGYPGTRGVTTRPSQRAFEWHSCNTVNDNNKLPPSNCKKSGDSDNKKKRMSTKTIGEKEEYERDRKRKWRAENKVRYTYFFLHAHSHFLAEKKSSA